jgi:hypothetical protein
MPAQTETLDPSPMILRGGRRRGALSHPTESRSKNRPVPSRRSSACPWMWKRPRQASRLDARLLAEAA